MRHSIHIIDGNYPFSVTQNNGNLPLSFLCGNYQIVLLDNISHDRICYMEKLRVTVIIQIIST